VGNEGFDDTLPNRRSRTRPDDPRLLAFSFSVTALEWGIQNLCRQLPS